MGVQGLMPLLYQRAPASIKEQEIKSYFGRVIAVDASMSIYQFLIAIQIAGETGGVTQLKAGNEVTSHLQGLWSRTLRMITEGLKPVYVFDGAPPEMKRKELEERKARAAAAQAELKVAIEAGDEEAIEKMSKRTVRVSKEQNADCMKLLTLMGLPVVQAKTEAEAQCAELVRGKKAWAVGTEDADALTFGSEVVLRHLSYSEAKKQPIVELHFKNVLEALELTREQFIDMCILLGCDYCPRIPGIGPVKAYEGIKKHKTIEALLEHVDTKKHVLPDPYPYKEARQLFKEPEVFPADDITVDFNEPDEEGLLKFMVDEKKFGRDRILAGIQKLRDARAAKPQMRLDQFFTVSAPSVASRNKRKLDENKNNKAPGKASKLRKGQGGKRAVNR